MKTETTIETAGTLTSYSVGTLDGNEAMMVIEFAGTPLDFLDGIRYSLPLVLSPEQARDLGRALALAADAAESGIPLNGTYC